MQLKVQQKKGYLLLGVSVIHAINVYVHLHLSRLNFFILAATFEICRSKSNFKRKTKRRKRFSPLRSNEQCSDSQ
jgi:DMSO/TMAO reductase YedYZ heme-binding membrane subunit